MSPEPVRLAPAVPTVRVRDFSRTPGARYRTDGPKSGEEFRETVLVAAFEAALDARLPLLVDLDGVAGYATSFLEEAFGGLARLKGDGIVMEMLRFVNDDQPDLADEIRGYIRDANNPKPKRR